MTHMYIFICHAFLRYPTFKYLYNLSPWNIYNSIHEKHTKYVWSELPFLEYIINRILKISIRTKHVTAEQRHANQSKLKYLWFKKNNFFISFSRSEYYWNICWNYDWVSNNVFANVRRTFWRWKKRLISFSVPILNSFHCSFSYSLIG